MSWLQISQQYFFRQEAQNEVDSLNSVKWMLYFVISHEHL